MIAFDTLPPSTLVPLTLNVLKVIPLLFSPQPVKTKDKVQTEIMASSNVIILLFISPPITRI